MTVFFEGMNVRHECDEPLTCEKCGSVFVYDKSLKQRMQKGYCSNCGALLFGTESKPLAAVGAELRPNL